MKSIVRENPSAGFLDFDLESKKMMNIPKLFLLTSLCAFTSSSQGAVTFFNDFGDWSAAAPSSLTYSITNGGQENQQIIHGDVTDVAGPINVLYNTVGNVDRGNNRIEYGNTLLNFTIDNGGDNQTTEMTFSFDSPVTAFGFDVQGLNTGRVGWTFDVDGESFSLADVIGASSGFAGFVSDNAVSSISLSNVPLTTEGDEIQFTNFYAETQTVPEPSIGMFFGLLGISALLRRQRR